jgi:hypothetical protein
MGASREDLSFWNVPSNMNGVRLLAIAALGPWFCLACSGPHERPRVSLPLPSAALASPSVPSAATTQAPGAGLSGTVRAPSAEATPADAARVARSSPIQALNQMLTAQALLVSLLLAPVGKDVGKTDEVLARLDPPAP